MNGFRMCTILKTGLGAFAVSVLSVASLAHAVPSESPTDRDVTLHECDELAKEGSNQQIRDCLNGFARAVLAGNVKIAELTPLNRLFELDFEDLRFAYGVSQRPSTPLSEQFRIHVPEVAKARDRHLRLCFDFEDARRDFLFGTPFTKALIRRVKAQILEAAIFLKTYHARSFGRVGSFLFQIRDVRICGDALLDPPSERIALFSDRALTISLPSYPYETIWANGQNLVTTADQLEKGWNNGSIPLGLDVNGPDTASIEKLAEKSPYIRAGLHLIWHAVNPIGPIRTPLRFEIEKNLEESFDTSSASPRQRLFNSVSRLGAKATDFKNESTGRPLAQVSDELAERILVEWKKIMNEPGLKERISEHAISASTMNVEMIDERDIKAPIIVKNEKQIVVNASMLFGGDDLGVEKVLDDEPRGSGMSVRQVLRSKIRGKLLAIDLSDQVAVRAALGTGLSKLIARVTLNRAVQRAIAQDPKISASR